MERLEEEIRQQKHNQALYEEEVCELDARIKDLNEWHVKMDACLQTFKIEFPLSPDNGYQTDSEPPTPLDHEIKEEFKEEEIKDEEMEGPQ